jgi:uncharacterized protein YbjT (DUF2867 family)
VLAAIGDRTVRIALMTAIGVTDRTGHYKTTEAHDWKRRSERLVRAIGHPYTIVRPGWFDYNSAEQQRVIMLQGDTRHTGRTTTDLEPLFTALLPDVAGTLDGVADVDNMPVDDEPASVQAEISAALARVTG